MEFVLLNQEQKEIYSRRILELMTLSDKDFVPPLSARTSTLQKKLDISDISGDVTPYFNEMIKQNILAFIEDGVFLGFVSFKENYVNEIIDNETLPNIYLSTLVMDKEARGKHLTQRAYEYLFNSLYPKHNIFTRTWATNIAHTKILEKFCFKEFYRIKNDRGNNIDTVYFNKTR